MAEPEDKNENDLSPTDGFSANFSAMLDDIGIAEGRNYEAIITTVGPHYNAAAIGIRRVDGKFQMKIFKMSNTFENIQDYQDNPDKCRIGINIIDSSKLDLLCYAALRGWGSPIPEFPPESYREVNDTPVLNDAAAWIICAPESSNIEEVKDTWGKSTRMNLTAGIVNIQLNGREQIKPIARGPDEPLLDALVYATKFKIAKGVMKDKCRSRVEELLLKAGNPTDEAHILTIEALKEYFGIAD
jgi:hypothetical protein